MRKKTIFILPLLTFVIAGCNNEKINRKEEEEKEEELVENKKVSELKENEYHLFPRYVVKSLGSYSSFKSVTKGQTVAKVLFIETVQSIDAEVIKGEYTFMKNESHSSVVNTSHIAYYHNDQAVYQNNGESVYHNLPLNEYLNVYGTYPLDNALEGYSVSKKAIKEVKKLESETNYKFFVEFNTKEATNNVRIQMKTFGGLDSYPSFSSVKMTLTVKDDFTPLSLELESYYTAQKIMNSDCHQTYTVTYTNYNETIEIEKLEEAKTHFKE